MMSPTWLPWGNLFDAIDDVAEFGLVENHSFNSGLRGVYFAPQVPRLRTTTSAYAAKGFGEIAQNHLRFMV